MQTIQQLLQNKGHEVFSLASDASVFEAIAIMADKGVGALVVLENECVVGLISERDYARNVILKGRSSKLTKVNEIMADRVFCIEPDKTIEQGMAIMTEKRVRHLPVIQEEELLGIISIGDLVKAIIEQQQFTIDQLVSYIKS